MGRGTKWSRTLAHVFAEEEADLADGTVQYYEGEPGAERMVQAGASEDKAAAEKRYKAMRVAELRSECERLGLATTGVKAALVARLLAA